MNNGVINRRVSFDERRRNDSADGNAIVNICVACCEITFAVFFLVLVFGTAWRYMSELKDCVVESEKEERGREAGSDLYMALILTLSFWILQAVKKLALTLYYCCSKADPERRNDIFWKASNYFCIFDCLALFSLVVYYFHVIKRPGAKNCLKNDSYFDVYWVLGLLLCCGLTCCGGLCSCLFLCIPSEDDDL